MRKRLVAMLTVGAVAGQLMAATVAAAEPCAQPRDKAAFDTAALKSELMVTALSCDMRDRYNAFVVRFRRDLVDQERALRAYFARSYGRRSTKQHDDYITSLANAESESGIRFGQDLCGSRAGLFDRVMALPTTRELPVLAAAEDLPQPIRLGFCSIRERRLRTASLSSHHTHGGHAAAM